MARHKRVLVLLAVAGVVVLQFCLQVVRPAASQLTHGFSAYVTASRLVRDGWSVDQFYDDRWFQAQTIRFGFVDAEDVYNLNPPSTALLFLPLSTIPPKAAKVVWTGVNLLLVGLALAGLIRIVRGGLVEVAIGAILLTTFQPLREDIRLGQIYLLLLALEIAVLWAYVERRSSLAGLPLGLILGFKVTGVGPLLLLASQRSWRIVAWAALAIGGVVGGSILLIGLSPWRRYVALTGTPGSHPELAVTAYQSVPGLFLHLLSRDATWNPSPIIAAPGLAAILIVASAVVLVSLTFLQTRSVDPSSRRDLVLAVAAWVIVEVMLSPAAEDYHFTLLLAPIAILLADWRDDPVSRRRLIALLLAIFLVGAPLPAKAESLAAGGWAVLAYPKLYGAFILWILAVRALRRHASRPSPAIQPAPEPIAVRGSQ